MPFYYASGSEFDEMFVGVGASRIRNLFSKFAGCEKNASNQLRMCPNNYNVSFFYGSQKRQKLMLRVSSSLMSWTALVERGLSLPCIPIPDKQSTSCWLKWTGQFSHFYVFKTAWCEKHVAVKNFYVLLLMFWYFTGLNQMKVSSLLVLRTLQKLWISKFTFHFIYIGFNWLI